MLARPPAAILVVVATIFISMSATVKINASASASDGSSNKVDFSQGSTRPEESVTTPETVNRSMVAANYSLTAKATENLGAVTPSSTIGISVNPPTGAISGTVTRTDGTTAIAGATVKVLDGTTLKGSAI